MRQSALTPPLPTAKLTRPEPARVFARTRLFERLEAEGQRVVWIAGPPGAGKTTLLSTYVADRQHRCLWYQLDAGDTDPATFLHYLGLAIQHAAPRQRTPLPALTPEYLPGLLAFARRFFERIYQHLKSPAVLVLDNYQELAPDSPVHEIIREASILLPPGLRMLIASNIGPPACFARLHLNGALQLWTPEDLHLTVEEAQGIAALHRHKAVHRPCPDCIEHLHAKTRGWAAGFALMLDQACQHNPGFPVGESNQQVLFDYFAAELFGKVSECTQAVLLKTALLPRMTVPMAKRLTGDSCAGALLADLHRRNFFIVRRAEAEPVYEYHPLFRDFLLSRAQQTFEPAVLEELRRDAAVTLESAGQIEEAAALYQAAGDWEGLARLLLSHAEMLLTQGSHQTLLQWLGLLPIEVLEQNPWLFYWYGMARLPFDQPEARGYFEQAYALFDRRHDPAGLYLAWAGVVETFELEWRDFTPLDHWIAAFELLRARYPEFPSLKIEMRVFGLLLGAAINRQPQHPELSHWAEHALTLLRSRIGTPESIALGVNLLRCCIWRGDLIKAGWVIDFLRPLAHKPGAPPLLFGLWCALGALYYWSIGRPKACLDLVAEGLEAARTIGMHAWDFLLYAQGVYGSLVSGDLESAEAFLREMMPAMKGHRYLDGAHYHFLSALLTQQRGNFEGAIYHGRTSLSMTTEAGTPLPQALSHLTLALSLLLRGEDMQGLEHLCAAQAINTAVKNRGLEYVCLLTEARIALERGKAAEGLDCLRAALVLSREGGGMVVGWWGPAEMARLYAKALGAGIEVEYVQKLIRRLSLIPPDPATAPESWPWPVKVYTLGRFSVLRDGEPIHFTAKAQKKPLELLQCLIALGGCAVPEERIAQMLWPEAEGDAAHNAFTTTLHRLRRLLDHGPALKLEGHCLSLDPRYVWVDVWAFERLLGRLGKPKEAGSPSPTASVEQALVLYQGDFLKGDQVPWVLVPRERLRSKYLRAVEWLGSRLEQAEEWQGAVDWYLKALEVDPLAECFYCRLMRCYEKLGRRAEALGVYQRCRQALLIYLGITPGLEMLALYQALLGA